MKKKLFASALSLAMAFILLTSSSFAWFSVATRGDINKVEASMSSVNILEIQKDDGDGVNETVQNDAGSEFYYGNFVTYSIPDDFTVDLPAKIDSGALKTVGHDATGRTTDLGSAATGTFVKDASDKATGVKVYTVTDNGASKKVGYGLNGYVRSNTTELITITLTNTGSLVSSVALTDNEGAAVALAAGENAGEYTFTPEAGIDYHYEVLLYFDGDNIKTPNTSASGTVTVSFTDTTSGDAYTPTVE